MKKNNKVVDLKEYKEAKERKKSRSASWLPEQMETTPEGLKAAYKRYMKDRSNKLEEDRKKGKFNPFDRFF